ncbi:MAG: hypothetical protein K1X74_14930 [Pirellulales bacterium]|nr:hypothetical protein [Pirellulales bacterium]
MAQLPDTAATPASSQRVLGEHIGRIMAIIVLVLDGIGLVLTAIQWLGLGGEPQTMFGAKPPAWLAVGSAIVAAAGTLAAILVLARHRRGARLALVAAALSVLFLLTCCLVAVGEVVQLYSEVYAPGPEANDETTKTRFIRLGFTVATIVGAALGAFYRGLLAWATNRSNAQVRLVA